jgi:cytidylate kinase
MRITIAIDGPAAAGKGTISKAVAERFGLAHLDTGLLYRAVGAKVLDGAEALEAARALVPADLEAPDLRRAEVAQMASQVAAIPEVRAALVAFQRDFARQEGGAVLDGRDIGTVICPEADLKFFVIASPETRARRRYDELRAGGAQTTFDAVLADVCARDDRDMNRTDAPLKPAGDALLIDTTDLSVEAAIETVSRHIRERLAQDS